MALRQSHAYTVMFPQPPLTTFVKASIAKGDPQPAAPTLQLDYARTVEVQSADPFTTTTPVAITITGLDADNFPATDTIIIPAGTSHGIVVKGIIPFAQITQITWTTPVGWTVGNFWVAFGEAFGLPSPNASAIQIEKETTIPYVIGAGVAPVSVDAGGIGSGSRIYTPRTVLNGNNSFCVLYNSIV